jgi:RecA-family ATPase
MLSGHGATGKTTLALQLCVATVLGRDWLGFLPEPGPALMVCCEDDEEELHRRLSAIATYYGTGFAELASRGLHLISRAGETGVLAAQDGNNGVKPTPLFHRLRTTAVHLRPRITVLDNAADIYSGNENGRSEARQCVSLLRRLAIDADTAVLVALHPSLTGITSDTGMSGSTAWYNSIRSQLYLKPASAADGEPADPDLRDLEHKKNNYGQLASPKLLRWSDGVFQVEAFPTSRDREAVGRAAEELFLRLLSRFWAQGRIAGDKKGPSYAPVLFSVEPEAKAARITKAQLEAAMLRLFVRNEIHVEQYGRPSRPSSKIVLGAGNLQE